MVTVNDTTRYGKAEARAWDRVHPRLTHRSAWIALDGELPLVEGALIRLKVDHLPRDRAAPPVWPMRPKPVRIRRAEDPLTAEEIELRERLQSQPHPNAESRS